MLVIVYRLPHVLGHDPPSSLGVVNTDRRLSVYVHGECIALTVVYID